MMMRVNRIRELRQQKGWTLLQLAEAAGTTHQQIHRLETGQRRLTTDWLMRLAKALECRPFELLPSTDDERVTVPIVGYVGAGEKVVNVEDPEGGLGPVVAPRGGEHMAAIVVKGDSMWPAYQEGDVLFFEPTTLVQPDAIGRECVVQVRAGPTYVKRVFRGNKAGRYRLASYKAPDIDDVDLLWAARVRWIQRS
jgi:phage repressor protein C with HTH and peptisase S24 domain